ncbi:MAG: thiamine phosphate synthase [Nitratireductor sp.]
MNAMSHDEEHVELEDRCRVVLIAPTGDQAVSQVSEALQGGDVASVIINQGDLDEVQYREHANALIPVIQEAGVAALLVADTQLMGRSDADGIFISNGIDALIEGLEKFSPKKIVGFGGAKDRHNSMMAGDIGPDFIFFGKLNGDIKPEAHPKNIKLAEWWSQLVSIPCVVMAGSDLQSVVEVAQNRADFVALNLAIFRDVDGPKAGVAKANALLEEFAPSLKVEE